MKVEIKKSGINGEGIGYVNKQPVFIQEALPEETVEIKRPRLVRGLFFCYTEHEVIV